MHQLKHGDPIYFHGRGSNWATLHTVAYRSDPIPGLFRARKRWNAIYRRPRIKQTLIEMEDGERGRLPKYLMDPYWDGPQLIRQNKSWKHYRNTRWKG